MQKKTFILSVSLYVKVSAHKLIKVKAHTRRRNGKIIKVRRHYRLV